MVDALLQGFGLRPGRYTSPHLDSITERIVVDGQPISEDRFVEAWDELAPSSPLVDERSPCR
jgi:dihydrofolate synthase/folylpolyglutamate synthase